MVGTIFQGTHVPLRNWYLCLVVVMGVKKPLSAYQIAQDLGMRRPTVWSMMRRIRTVMVNDPAQAKMLRKLVALDASPAVAKRRRGGKG